MHTRAQPQASFQAEATPRSIMGPGGRFSKGPLTWRVRKAILETMVHWQWKAALLLFFRYKERQNNCQVFKVWNVFLLKIQRKLCDPKLFRNPVLDSFFPAITASMPRPSTDHQEDAFPTFPLDGKFPRVGIYYLFPPYPTRKERHWTNQCKWKRRKPAAAPD